MRDAGPCGTTGDDCGFVTKYKIINNIVVASRSCLRHFYGGGINIDRSSAEPQGDLPRRAKGRSEPRELRITDGDAIGSGLRPAKRDR